MCFVKKIEVNIKLKFYEYINFMTHQTAVTYGRDCQDQLVDILTKRLMN